MASSRRILQQSDPLAWTSLRNICRCSRVLTHPTHFKPAAPHSPATFTESSQDLRCNRTKKTLSIAKRVGCKSYVYGEKSGIYDVLTLKWNLFSSSLFISVSLDLFLNFNTTKLFNNKSWVRELSQGKNPREIPFDAEAEVTQMAAGIVKIFLKAWNLQMCTNAWDWGKKKTAFSPSEPLESANCQISTVRFIQIIMHVFWETSCL